MPSSDPITIPKVIDIMMELQPTTILEIGCGNGRYGFLFRECLDWNYGRLDKKDWCRIIDGIEIDESYINPVHRYVYDTLIVDDWLTCKVPNDYYDVTFMGDVLEHWEEGQWQKALEKAKDYSRVTIVVAPNWVGSLAQKEWYGHKYEEHKVVLSPQKVGGKCLFANPKAFLCMINNY